jgi:hypothetical protein
MYPDSMSRQELPEALYSYCQVRDWEVRLKRQDGATYDATLSVEHNEVGGEGCF